MNLDSHSYSQQVLLSSYVRSGDQSLIRQMDKVNEKGVKYYHKLVQTIFNDAIITAYPIMTEFMGEEQMQRIVSRFLAQHPCKESRLWAMPGEFFEYVKKNEHELMLDYPFLHDLMLFEWLEVKLFMMPDHQIRPYTSEGSLYSHPLVINTEFYIVILQYPVFILHPRDCSKESRGEYQLLMYRHRESREVHFCAISNVVSKTLKILSTIAISYYDLEHLNLLKPQELEQIKAFIPEALKRGIIHGFLKKDA